MNQLMIAIAAPFTGIVPLLLDSVLKGAALLILAAMSVLILRKVSAATRHLVWLFAVGALLVLPVLSALLPGWAVLPRLNTAAEKGAPSFNSAKLPPSPADQTAVVKVELPATSPARSVTVQEIAPAKSFHVRDWLMPVWMAGVTLLLMRLIVAQWFLSRAEIRCTAVPDPRLAETKQAVLRKLNIRRPLRLLVDSRPTIPMAWGVFRPRVLLPAEAADWDEPRLRAILLHEMAHVKRGDAAARWLAQLSCALYWFNPLVWFAAWRLHVESERACDDLVLTNGVRASDYAKDLLHVATTLSSAQMTQASGLAMARPSGFEGRLVAVLNQRANRRHVTRAWGFAALTLGLCVVIPVAMLRAASEKTLGDAVVEGRTNNQKSTNEDHAIPVAAAETNNSLLRGSSAAKPADAGNYEVNRIKWLRAETELQRATELRERNLISETDFNKAREEMEIAYAEFAGRPDEVVRIKLRNAEADLARQRELQKANLISKDMLDQAEYNVALLRAEISGDAAEAARVRLHQAEGELKRASQLRQRNLMSDADYNDAKQQVKLRQAELRRDEVDGSPTISSTYDMQPLLKARDEARAKAAAAEKKWLEAGAWSEARVEALGFASAKELRDQEAASGSKGEAYDRYAKTARQIEEKVQNEIVRGAQSPLAADIARFERLQAEVDLARITGRFPADGK